MEEGVVSPLQGSGILRSPIPGRCPGLSGDARSGQMGVAEGVFWAWRLGPHRGLPSGSPKNPFSRGSRGSRFPRERCHCLEPTFVGKAESAAAALQNQLRSVAPGVKSSAW